MAGEFVVGHGHCPDCGSCLIGGFTQENHNCQARPVDKAVLRVMFTEMRSTDQKTRDMLRTQYVRELERYGFHIERA